MQFFPENHHTKRQRRRRHLGICIVFCAVAGASVPRATAENECELIWSTYVGGGAFDYGSRVAADAWGNVYVTGGTESADFPVAAPGDVNYNGGIADAYVMKFAYNGSLLWSTYLGGSGEDHGYGIAVDISGKVYVTGYTTSTDFPVTPGCAYSSHSGGFDVFVAAFSAGGTPMWATYLGGSGEDRAYGAAVNEWGEVYIAGITRSNNFPMKGSFSTPYSGAYDAFVAKLSSDGNVVWSISAATGSFCGPRIWAETRRRRDMVLRPNPGAVYM